jgi:drug/metabolite transporter (DMT)-like permease
MAVMRTTQGLAFVGLVVVAAAAGELGATGYLPWGLAGGFIGVVSLSCFYAALAGGTMGVVAPIAATGAIVPVAVGFAQGESPTIAQGIGIVIALVGVVLASGPERSVDATSMRKPLLMAAVAALGFGAALVTVAEGGEHSVVMTLVVMRGVNAVVASILLALFVRSAVEPRRSDLPALAVISATDAGANGMYALAAGMSLVSVTAVLGSLYPAVTVLLAWRFHQERLRRIQVVGVVLTLVGVAFLAGGA